MRTGRLEEGRSDLHLKSNVDGKIEWEEYQQLVMEGFRGREEHMEVLWMGKDRESVEQIWELWCHIVLQAAEIGIGKKKLTERSKDWWSREIEEAIQSWKVSCRKLREARSGNVGDESLLRQWEE